MRKALSLGDVVLVLQYFLTDLYDRLKLPCPPTQLDQNVTIEDKLYTTKERAQEMAQYPAVQAFIYVMLLQKLIDDGDISNAKEFGDFVLLRLKGANSRTLDHFGAKAVYFISVAYEISGALPQLRQQMFDYYKECCLEQNAIGQATVLNIIIRSYLQQNLYEQARNFIQKTTFPESVSNNQYTRYLYYVGKIKAITLEYSEAAASLTQSQRKGPEFGAFGFRLQVQKLILIVQLLMGEIPNREIFSQKEFQKPLYPYFQVVNTVKQGDMEKFKQLIDKYQRIFKADKVITLIMRLRHIVIIFGLKKINISYSKISLHDIMAKLSLESVEETEQIVAKAIRDGVIEAQINHEQQYISSLPITDVYSTNDPQSVLHRRIKFCMDLRADAVKALTYPAKEEKKDFKEDSDEDEDEGQDLLSRLLEDMGMGDF